MGIERENLKGDNVSLFLKIFWIMYVVYVLIVIILLCVMLIMCISLKVIVRLSVMISRMLFRLRLWKIVLKKLIVV